MRKRLASLVPIGLLTALAVGLRVAWVLAVPSKPVGDFAMYLESAAYLREHGALDERFIYMPGYVLLVALVQSLGGGWLAIKLTVAVSSGAATIFVHGVTERLWHKRAALAAALLYAVWPGGIAVASVTGTDIPALVLLLAALFVLVRWGVERPWRAAIGFGAVLGLCAYLRAVALPLAVLSSGYFLVVRPIGKDTWRRAGARAAALAAVALATALLVLSPWAVRNRIKYGEWVFTDSHGGLTALVGAYPNSNGRYTRALNRSFADVTGMQWLEPPHRAADHTAYALAREWKAFDRRYSRGLAIARAEKLLGDERSLLYWPLYRDGVLRPGLRLDFFARWRREIEIVVDTFWWGLLAASTAGFVLAAARREGRALVPLPFVGALITVYVLYFAESRYHLPIAGLLFPSAGGALIWFAERGRAWWVARTVPRAEGLLAASAMMVPIVLFVTANAVFAHGQRLLEQHRFAAHRCQIGERRAFCLWRPAAGGGLPSPVRGIFDGVGLDLVPGAAATLQLPLPTGRYHIRAHLELDGKQVSQRSSADGEITLAALGGRSVTIDLARIPTWGAAPIELMSDLPSGAPALSLTLSHQPGLRPPPASRVWLTSLSIEATASSDP